MSDRILQFNDVGVRFHRRLNPFSEKHHILKGLTFELYRGETLGVIGHNGAGKSTLLKLLGEIIAPDSGTIIRPKGLRSQLLSLSLGFNKNLSGYDNTVMALVTQGVRIHKAKSLASEVASFGGVEHLMDQPVGTYSAGERARLGFSIAIRTSPEILLLDEILGVGDKQFKERSSNELKKRVNSDQTAVLVSHSVETLRELCDRVLWMEKGRVNMLGPAGLVLDSYSKSTKSA